MMAKEQAAELSPVERIRVEALGLDKPDEFTETDWPSNADQATADQMVRNSARQGAIEHETALLWMKHAGRVEMGTDERRRRNHHFVTGLGSFIANAQVALLLVEVQKRDSALADELARLAWDLTEDGGVLAELSWEWLHDRGVDADSFYDWARSVAVERFAIEEPAS